MFKVFLRKKIRYEDIRKRTKVIDIAYRISKLKWRQWAGYVCSQTYPGVEIASWQTQRDLRSPLAWWAYDLRKV